MQQNETRSSKIGDPRPLDPDAKLDEALEESFPASDPVSVMVTGIRRGDVDEGGSKARAA